MTLPACFVLIMRQFITFSSIVLLQKKVWEEISIILGINIGLDYESIARLWLCNKRFDVANIISLALYWCLWKLRNGLCFQEMPWTGIRRLCDMTTPTTPTSTPITPTSTPTTLTTATPIHVFDGPITRS
jgi:hypothetical protein